MEKSQSQIDMDVYAQQISTYGIEALTKFSKMSIFIYGLRGVGLETAKNVILTGPARVVIQDNEKVEGKDLGSTFSLIEEDIGRKTRGQASLDQLKQLNPSVYVDIHEIKITNEFLTQFDVVVFTDYYDRKRLAEFNKICRNSQRPIGFIYGGCLGLYGFVFVDFGEKFMVLDTIEDKRHTVISDITNEKPAKVITHNKHNLSDDDHVIFSVEGMDELNGKKFQVKVLSSNIFTINYDATGPGNLFRYGQVERISVVHNISFNSLEVSLEVPINRNDFCFLNPDMNKEGRPEQLHIALNAILYFYDCHQRLPQLLNQKDEDEIVRICEKISMRSSENEERIKCDKIDEDLLRNIARFARTQLSPHASFFGGIIAQEVLKYTGKFMPLRQWLHYETFEVLPDSEVNREICNSRYDDQIIVFGKEFQNKLMNQRLFLVGSGALGCEFIKQFALMGLCCESKGKLTCSDKDMVRMYDPYTQFLFNKADIGKSKSEVACEIAKKINKSLKAEPLKFEVCKETQHVFNPNFWESQDIVISAVNSINTRLFIDSECVVYGRNLLESGVCGTKCSTQIIVPYQTQSYSDSTDPTEEFIPLRTLRHFPFETEHFVQWAKDYFENTFFLGPNQYIKYIANPLEYLKEIQKEFFSSPISLRNHLEAVNEISDSIKELSHETCIKLARLKFQEIFYDQIETLLEAFPPDHKARDDQPFWRGLKRLPKLLIFDASDEAHLNFIVSAATLYARVLNLSLITDKLLVAKICSDINPNVLKSNKKNAIETEVRVSELVQILSSNPSSLSEGNNISPIQFDKDDDSGVPLDFISATANLRAQNYRAKEIPKYQAKMIAGKISPALPITTSMVGGYIGFEIYKILAGKNIGNMRNLFCNLAIPLWIFSEPAPIIKNKDKNYDPVLLGPAKAIPPGWSTWNKIDIKGPMTLQNICNYLELKYGVIPIVVSTGDLMLYIKGNFPKDRLKMTPEEIYKLVKNKDFPPYQSFLEILISGQTIEDEVDVNMPSIRYILN